MQGLYQPPAQPSPPATLLGQIPSVPTHHSPNLLGATHMPQLGRTNRLNSMPPLPFVGQSGFPSGPNQFQHFLDMLLQSANGGSNINQSNPWSMMGGASSNVSHMSQDQYEEQAFVTQKTDQFYTKLDQEIYKLQNKIKFKLQGIEPERQSALRRIESSIKDTYSECPNARVEMYGSMATGLAIDSSDMDLLVSGVFTNMMQQDIQKHVYFPRPPLSVVDRSLLVEQMKRLFRELTNMESSNQGVTALKECLEDVKIIETASVPVIKLVIDLQKIREIENRVASSTTQIDDDMRLLKIDITFNDLQSESLDLGFFAQGFQPLASTIHMGIRCCQFVKKKLEEYQILESLTLVLKKFLALRNMNQPYQGGLNSYGLIILIVTYLNLNLPDFYNKEGQLSAARVLKHFLSYFGRHFDSNYYIINEQQQIVPEINYSSILVIRDPLNPMNNIGKSTFNFDNIRAEFARAHDEIERHLQEFIQNSSAAEEQATSEEAKAGKSSVVWKKRLDILSKILTPDTFAGAISVAEAQERGSPSPKISHAITENSVNPENEQKNQEENQEQ
ncbi:hypothetical protein FGO68_gene8183 [Halteria grandinella]|uniref:Poly(A) RNA polymerase mitochondrial-like central palm domain-containing protein n=1 Tax=Halteria grandinella TaxID=5974 RepID=A0A8J8NI38_HALGN|nr:hypothetical protein FGO68_gene8183 [Halteria grandinella]